MSSKPFINSNYTQLPKYLILADHNYLSLNAADLATKLGTDLAEFTPIVDEIIHDNINYDDTVRYFRIRRATSQYKVIPARYQATESALLFKSMHQVVANPQIADHDFVLFALPGISLGSDFAAKVATVLAYLQQPAQAHLDCALLDYTYLGTENNLVGLVSNHHQLDQDPAYTQIIQTCKPFDHLAFIPSSITKLTVPLADDTNTSLTVGIPSCMGITYSHCFLLRKSRMARILKQKRPHWLISDIKRYVPVTSTLIVTPSLVNTPYPEYDLSIARQDILELNRQYIQHTMPIDIYRKHLYHFLPWLATLGTQPHSLMSKPGKLLHQLLAFDNKL